MVVKERRKDRMTEDCAGQNAGRCWRSAVSPQATRRLIACTSYIQSQQLISELLETPPQSLIEHMRSAYCLGTSHPLSDGLSIGGCLNMTTQCQEQ